MKKDVGLVLILSIFVFSAPVFSKVNLNLMTGTSIFGDNYALDLSIGMKTDLKSLLNMKIDPNINCGWTLGSSTLDMTSNILLTMNGGLSAGYDFFIGNKIPFSISPSIIIGTAVSTIGIEEVNMRYKAGLMVAPMVLFHYSLSFGLIDFGFGINTGYQIISYGLRNLIINILIDVSLNQKSGGENE